MDLVTFINCIKDISIRVLNNLDPKDFLALSMSTQSVYVFAQSVAHEYYIKYFDMHVRQKYLSDTDIEIIRRRIKWIHTRNIIPIDMLINTYYRTDSPFLRPITEHGKKLAKTIAPAYHSYCDMISDLLLHIFETKFNCKLTILTSTITAHVSLININSIIISACIKLDVQNDKQNILDVNVDAGQHCICIKNKILCGYVRSRYTTPIFKYQIYNPHYIHVDKTLVKMDLGNDIISGKGFIVR